MEIFQYTTPIFALTHRQKRYFQFAAAPDLILILQIIAIGFALMLALTVSIIFTLPDASGPHTPSDILNRPVAPDGCAPDRLNTIDRLEERHHLPPIDLCL